jgi:hypothetical protein
VIREITGKHRCDKLQLPAAAAVEEGRMARALAAMLAGACPTCLVPIAGEMEFNESLLAMPCRHVIRSAK